jgi:hypothetical protein
MVTNNDVMLNKAKTIDDAVSPDHSSGIYDCTVQNDAPLTDASMWRNIRLG